MPELEWLTCTAAQNKILLKSSLILYSCDRGLKQVLLFVDLGQIGPQFNAFFDFPVGEC